MTDNTALQPPSSDSLDAIEANLAAARAELARAVGDERQAQRDAVRTGSEDQKAALGRARARVQEAQGWLQALEAAHAEAADWAQSEARRNKLRGAAQSLKDAIAVIDQLPGYAQALDQALAPLAAAAQGYIACQRRLEGFIRAFVDPTVDTFDATHDWRANQRRAVYAGFDEGVNLVADRVIGELDAMFRPLGGAWTSNAAMRHGGYPEDCAERQTAASERLQRRLKGVAARFGVEVPE